MLIRTRRALAVSTVAALTAGTSTAAIATAPEAAAAGVTYSALSVRTDNYWSFGAADPVSHHLYVDAYDTSPAGVAEVDPTTGAQLAKVPTGSSPDDAVYDPSSQLMFFVQPFGQQQSVVAVRPSDNTLVATVAVTTTPYALAVDPAAHQLFVSGSASIAVIDTQSLTVVSTFATRSGTLDLAVDSEAGAVFTTNYAARTVDAYDTATGAFRDSVEFDSAPEGLAVDPGVHRLFVAYGSGTVGVVDSAAVTQLPDIAVTGTNSRASFAVDATHHRVYVATRQPVVDVIDTQSLTSTAVPLSGTFDSFGVAADPSTGVGYAFSYSYADADSAAPQRLWTITPAAANAAPVAVIGSASCRYAACTFEGSGSTDSDGTINSYAWNFGDGATGTGATTSHTYASAGTYTVSLTVTDDDGATDTTTTTVTATALSAYGQRVVADGAAHYYRLGDTTPGTGKDEVGTADLVERAGVTQGEPGLIAGDSDTAARFNGNDPTGGAYVPQFVDKPDVFSVQGWISTTTTRGGKIIGFGNRATGTSTNYDRHVYMDDAGHLLFSVYQFDRPNYNAPHTPVTIISDRTYNDGLPHQITASMTGTGMELYVDGAVIGVRDGVKYGEPHGGYWRIGGDDLNEWPNTPTSDYFAGTIDEFAIYPAALTASQVKAQYRSGSGVADQAPTAVIAAPMCDQGSCTFDGTGSSDPDGSVASYAWTFGDNATSTDARPTHIYAASGTYTVSLVVTDDEGVSSAAATRTLVVTVNQAPTGVVATPSCTYLACSFDGSGSTDADGTVASYAWNFGDGSTGTGPKPDHTYATAGSYTVTLVVTDNDGADSAPATVGLAVRANPAPTAVIATPSCTYLACTFDGRGSTDDGRVVGYAWDFGDGQVGSGAQPQHTYTRGGNYTVTLVVTDDQGATSGMASVTISPKANQAPTAAIGTVTCEFLVCSFASNSTDPDGSVASVKWSFDDSTTSTRPNPSHTFPRAGAYVVTLVAVDDQGRSSQKVTREIFVVANVAPVAAFSRQCTYLGCTFDASRSSDSDGNVASYAWDFGDGTTGTGVTTSHVYDTAGTYTVTLRVTDDQGSRSKLATASLTVAPNKAPAAAFSYTCTDLTCTFDAATSTDPDGTIASYAWNFGDGTSGTGITTTNTFAARGRYAVSLTVTDDGGRADTAKQALTVVVANRSPVATFGSSGVGLAGGFDGRASTDPDGTITSYAWDFGDGTTGTGGTVRHTYAADGTYPVTLTVTDNKGGTAAFTDQLTIANAPGRVLIADSFDTEVARGWGLPSVGWGYSYGPGDRSIFAEDAGVGRMTVGRNQTVSVSPTVFELNTTQRLDIGVADATLPATGFTAGLTARRSVGAAYQLRVTVAGNGAVTLTAVRVMPNQPDLVLAQQVIAGLTATPSSTLRLQFTVKGSTTPVLTGTVWNANSAQPAAQITASDTAAGALTRKDGVGLFGTTLGTNPTGAVVLRFDNYQVLTP